MKFCITLKGGSSEIIDAISIMVNDKIFGIPISTNKYSKLSQKIF